MKQNAINYHSLLAAVISRAIEDLKEAGPRCGRNEPDRAMAFILSETCEAYCLELEIDCKTVREKAAGLYRRIIEHENNTLLFYGEAAKKRRGRPPGRHTMKPIRKPYPSAPKSLTISK